MNWFKQGISKIKREGFKIFPKFFSYSIEKITDAIADIRNPRCICVDMGSQQIKYALIQRSQNDISILEHGLIDLKEDALLNTEEVDQQLARIVTQLGEYPLAITVSQNLVISQLINLPDEVDTSSPDKISQYLKDTCAKGMGNTPLLIGWQKLKKFRVENNKFPNPCHAHIAKEQGITELIGRFVNCTAPIINVLPTLNAATTSFINKGKVTSRNVVLVDIGAISTHAAIIYDGQSILSANFPIGGEYLTEYLSKALRCTFDEAEQFKRQNNYLTGEHVNAIFQAAVKRWLKDLTNWFMELARSTASFTGTTFSEDTFKEQLKTLTVYLSGAASLTPGLLEYLRNKSEINFLHITAYEGISNDIQIERFASCIGLGLETFGIMPNSGSLTPNYLLDARRTNRLRFRILITALILAPLLLILLLASIGFTFVSASKNVHKIHEIENISEDAFSIVKEYQLRDQELLSYAPILRMQKRTSDVLNIIKAQQDIVVSETNHAWFLLLADKHTYVQGFPSPDNYTNSTIQMGDTEDIDIGKYSYISELCLLTNQNADLQRVFFYSVRDELTNLFFIDYADTLLPGLFRTNSVDPKYLVGGNRFGTIFTTKEVFLNPTNQLPKTFSAQNQPSPAK